MKYFFVNLCIDFFFVYSLANALLSRFYLNYYSKSWPSLEISIILLKSCFPWCMQCQIWCNAIRDFAPDGTWLMRLIEFATFNNCKRRQKKSFLLGCFKILPPFSSHQIWKIVNLLFFMWRRNKDKYQTAWATDLTPNMCIPFN